MKYTFAGKVQGVGFRHTARQIATELNLKGYVRNQEDGTVELTVYGHTASIKTLIDTLTTTFKVVSKEIPNAPNFEIL